LSNKDGVAASSDFSAPLAVSAQRKNPAIIEGTAGTQPMYWLPAAQNPVEIMADEDFTIVKSRGRKNPVKLDMTAPSVSTV
jgi:hypothetical protein